MLEKQLGILLPKADHRRFEKFAAEQNRTMSEITREYLEPLLSKLRAEERRRSAQQDRSRT